MEHEIKNFLRQMGFEESEILQLFEGHEKYVKRYASVMAKFVDTIVEDYYKYQVFEDTYIICVLQKSWIPSMTWESFRIAAVFHHDVEFLTGVNSRQRIFRAYVFENKAHAIAIRMAAHWSLGLNRNVAPGKICTVMPLPIYFAQEVAITAAPETINRNKIFSLMTSTYKQLEFNRKAIEKKYE